MTSYARATICCMLGWFPAPWMMDNWDKFCWMWQAIAHEKSGCFGCK